jgi:very-short-patch-repair endonuclease
VLDPWTSAPSRAQQWRASWARRAATVAVTPALEQGFVLTHAQCYALGFSSAQLRRLIRREIWWAPRRAVIAVVHPEGDDDVRATLAASAAALLRPGSGVSHESAATMHGLPVLHRPPRPRLTVDHGRSGPGPSSHIYRAPRSGAQATWYGVPLTTPARTVLDIARVERDAGLVSADAALAEHMTSAAQLQALVGASRNWPGNVSARWVAEHADALAESPLESLTRSCLLIGGLPAPELQAWIPEAGARVDLLYRAERVVIEADGALKYAGSALWKEKRRQERLERAGYRVVRVLWSDVLNDRAGTVARVGAALGLRALRP